MDTRTTRNEGLADDVSAAAADTGHPASAGRHRLPNYARNANPGTPTKSWLTLHPFFAVSYLADFAVRQSHAKVLPRRPLAAATARRPTI
jgi:hypothetical protein